MADPAGSDERPPVWVDSTYECKRQRDPLRHDSGLRAQKKMISSLP